MPERFVYLQYSDGLDYDIAIPLDMLKEEYKDDIFNFSDPKLIKIYDKLHNKIINSDTPNLKYSRYNITKSEMAKIVFSNKNSDDTMIGIIKHLNEIKNTKNERIKNDDISLCILYKGF